MTDTRLARRAANALLRGRCRRHLAALDRLHPERAQTRILLGVIHRARSTPFGRDHDFARIRTPDDFRRLVPMRTLDEIWKRYGRLDEMTWPGAARHVLPCDSLTEWPHFVPLSPTLEAARRAANQTALALVHRVRPDAAFCSGSVVFLGEARSSACLAEGNGEVPASQSTRQLPWSARPYAVAEPTLSMTARAAARTNLTCLGGSVPALLKLLAEVKRHARKHRIADVWPNLTAVLWSRKPSDPSADLLRDEVGDGVVCLEMVTHCGSPLAVEDPESGLLRWLPDHGVYFEFVCAAEAHRPQPLRMTFEQVEMRAAYELVLTSPAGLWACRTGKAVCFERRDPPLFRFVEVRSERREPSEERPAAEQPTPHSLVAHVTQPPHRRSAGIPAALPETIGHIPWLTPADRG
jgi:hypothetical protein